MMTLDGMINLKDWSEMFRFNDKEKGMVIYNDSLTHVWVEDVNSVRWVIKLMYIGLSVISVGYNDKELRNSDYERLLEYIENNYNPLKKQIKKVML